VDYFFDVAIHDFVVKLERLFVFSAYFYAKLDRKIFDFLVICFKISFALF
jgi:hypothetical protein